MAENQSNELDIKTNSPDLDQTEKKLRGLDRLLELTRRRAVLLGKTRITPTVTLVDRISSAAGKMGDSLKRLHQTQATPAVRLGAEQAINSVRELRGSLASLASSPWHVSTAGVDWEVAVGDSFTAWMSSDGKATLQRISSSISKALGDGMKDKMTESFALSSNEPAKTGGQGTTPGIPTVQKPPLFGPEGFRAFDLLTKGLPGNSSAASNNANNQGESGDKGVFSTLLSSVMGFSGKVVQDTGNDLAKEGLKELVKGLFPGKADKSNIKVTCICNCGGGWSGGANGRTGAGGGNGRGGSSRGGPRRVGNGAGSGTRTSTATRNRSIGRTGTRTSKLPGRLGKLGGSLKKLGGGLLAGSGVEALGRLGPKLLGGAKGIWDKVGGGLGKAGPKLLDGAKGIWNTAVPAVKSGTSKMLKQGSSLLGKGSKWIGKGLGYGAKGMKYIGKNIPFIGGLVDAALIATADSNEERVRATTSAIVSTIGGFAGGALGSLLPGAGTAIGATAGAIGGDVLGDKLGGYIYNKFFNKKDSADNTANSATVAVSSPSKSNQVVSPRLVQASTNELNYGTSLAYQQGQFPPNLLPLPAPPPPPRPFNVTLSPGALSLTVNKDEINYRELANKMGIQLADAMRMAMQNVK
ncbi:hypothetical protein [Paenibacillus sanguinis]|uniref:hypothetical protein n=1 Tax=Paenibacillus sanguinis TaxID=225906 RepID=UPI00035CAB36|nr:hypothetical protein [Paenibacillus sanguinis]